MTDFGQLVEYVTVDGIHNVALEAHNLDNPFVLAAVKTDYDHVAMIGRTPQLSAAELAIVKAAAPYHQDVIDNEITSNDPAVIVANLIAVRSRPEWRAWIAVGIGDVYFYSGNLYTVIQPHTTQPDWRPDITPALWKRFYEPEAGPQPWVQPTGAHDAYQLGDLVTFGGQTWRSTIANNVWQPGVYGWVVV